MSQTSEVRMAVVSPENEEESQVMGRRQGLFHVFHDLEICEEHWPGFCRGSLNLGLSDVSSWLDWDCVFLPRIPQGADVASSLV